jgi:hypothetical protein
MLSAMRQVRWGIAGSLIFCLCALSCWGGGESIAGSPSGPILAAGNNRVLILSSSGQVLWQYPAGLVHDVWMLHNGNVLFADGISVTEVTPDKEVAFQYKSASQAGGGTFSCQRLPNGNTLIGETRPARSSKSIRPVVLFSPCRRTVSNRAAIKICAWCANWIMETTLFATPGPAW